MACDDISPRSCDFIASRRRSMAQTSGLAIERRGTQSTDHSDQFNYSRSRHEILPKDLCTVSELRSVCDISKRRVYNDTSSTAWKLRPPSIPRLLFRVDQLKCTTSSSKPDILTQKVRDATKFRLVVEKIYRKRVATIERGAR